MRPSGRPFAILLAASVALCLYASPAVAQICGDLDNSGRVAATDALLLLQRAVGLRVTLHCRECSSTTTTTFGSPTTTGTTTTTIAASIAGVWMGTFSGDDSGSFTITVDTSGDITGSGTSAAAGVFDVVGAVSPVGDLVATGGGTSDGSTFTGTLSPTGTGSGTWENQFFGESGTWTAVKVG